MTETDIRRANKRAARLTEAKILVARAARLCQLKPYPSEERQLIKDMRLALADLMEEVGQ